MIVRKYGRRSRDYSVDDSFSDVVSDSPSQDVYDFTFSSQEDSAARCRWSDPYSCSSSQDSKKLTFLPTRNGDFGKGFRKSKKLKVVDDDSEPYGSGFSQESKEFGILKISEGGFKKPKNLKKISNSKKVDFDPSQEMEEDLSILLSSEEQGREKKNYSVFEFSEDVDVWKPKQSDPYEYNSSQEQEDLSVLLSGNVDVWKSKQSKKVDSDPYEYNSSQEQEDLSILLLGKGKENSHSVFEFSEDVDNGSQSHGVSELVELGISQQRKLDSWDFDGVSRKKTKKKDRKENGFMQKKSKNKMKMKLKEPESSSIMLTPTLMETQEFGEMTENVDEVNFALDGLKKGAQVRTRRASLLSLLSICGTDQQRDLLRIQGMAKAIIDTVLGLGFDDPPSNIASAALFYILTSDGQNDYRLDSPSCIRFLVKLLNPHTASVASEKLPTIGFGGKLLGICKKAGFSQDSAKEKDSSSTAINLKVKDVLVNCKEMKPKHASDNRTEEPEINAKWISLLIMEKACSPAVSIEDTFGTVRKPRSNFKEKLREFGGLDAVFEVARKCCSTMEEWLEKSPTFALELKDDLGLESLVVILKCLKIMENATFLSKDNQSHLLGIKGNFAGQRAPRSFTKLILSVIKILSGVSLLRSSLGSDEKMEECTDSQKSFDASQNSYADPLRVESSIAGSSNSGSMEYSQDPFAFGEVDFEPSKWDLVSGRVHKSRPQLSCKGKVSESRDEKHSLTGLSQSTNVEDPTCSSSIDDDMSSLLTDCLLTSIKVLMNLANENPEGCRQIAACGGLEITASLIAGHFPSSLISKSTPRIGQQSNTLLNDQELDFLVAILGLLVNLVEKDGRNRSRLAAASVSVPSLKDEREVISLLCSIFLTNQGAGEATEDGKCVSLAEEDTILQGEKEAEKMIVEAYSALLLAFLSTESKSIRNAIAKRLPKQNLTILVPVLERFVEFHMTLNVISPETHKAVLEVIESCRLP